MAAFRGTYLSSFLLSFLSPQNKIPKRPINFHLEMLPGVPHGCQNPFVLSFRQWDNLIRSPFVPWKSTWGGKEGYGVSHLYLFIELIFPSSWRECSRGSAVDFWKFTVFKTALLLLRLYGHPSLWRMRSRITAVEKPPLHSQNTDLLMCNCLRVGDTHRSYWKSLILLHPGSPTSV